MVIVINKWAHLSPSLFPSTDLLFLRLHRGSRPPEISSRSSKVIAGPLHVYFLDFFSAFDRFEAGFPRAWFVFPIWIAFRFWFVTVLTSLIPALWCYEGWNLVLKGWEEGRVPSLLWHARRWSSPFWELCIWSTRHYLFGMRFEVEVRQLGNSLADLSTEAYRIVCRIG